MGIPWEWELVKKLGMGIDCTRMVGNGNVKSHSLASLLVTNQSMNQP